MTQNNIQNFLNKKLQAINILNNYAIEIGIVEHDTNRKSQIKDVTNAMLMYIHEHGSVVHNLPSRPVLRLTIEYTRSNLLGPLVNKCMNGIIYNYWTETDIQRELNIMCKRMQNYARKIIYNNDGTLEDNAPSTIKRKGYNHPLFQTGQLARSITCRLVKIN